MTPVLRGPLAFVLLASACADAPGTATTSDAASTTSSSDPVTAPTTSTATSSDTGSSDASTGPGEPVCCGCLCLDPTWSCAADTCLHADGTASALAPEAGFLARPLHSFSTFVGGVETVEQAPEARMWYAFRPADESPESKPLAVFFNGGPGYSSATLFGFNTNASTLDPDFTGGRVLAPNPHSWTRFANVLYIDPRESGYSYEVTPPGPPAPEFLWTVEHDAADFVHLVIAFLARHPQIQSNPVVLVGESYGGHRSAMMLSQILHPGRLGETKRYRDPTLRDALLAHFAVVFPEESAAEDLRPSVIARQFGHQVLIQPAITWAAVPVTPTPDEQQILDLGCVADPDPLQCDESLDWSDPGPDAVRAALTDPKHLGTALGVDATTIAWMYADERAAAVPRGPAGTTHDEADLRAVFGELAASERYYYPYVPHDKQRFLWWSPYYLNAYLETFYYARAFITDAGKDITVFAPDIPAYLAANTQVVTAVVHDETPVAGEARPGRLRLTYDAAIVPGEPERELRFPHYPLAGHVVSRRMPGELAADVCRWLALDCPLP